MKFGLKAEFAERTCIVVVQVKRPNDTIVQMALIVDSVEEIAHVPSEEIEPTPEFGARVDTTYLLDIDRVVAPETMQSVARRRPE